MYKPRHYARNSNQNLTLIMVLEYLSEQHHPYDRSYYYYYYYSNFILSVEATQQTLRQSKARRFIIRVKFPIMQTCGANDKFHRISTTILDYQAHITGHITPYTHEVMQHATLPMGFVAGRSYATSQFAAAASVTANQFAALPRFAAHHFAASASIAAQQFTFLITQKGKKNHSVTPIPLLIKPRRTLLRQHFMRTH